MKKIFTLSFLFVLTLLCPIPGRSQSSYEQNAHSIGSRDSLPAMPAVENNRGSRLQIGGYGEAVFQKMFFSDDAARYSSPQNYKDGKHGRFDLPHVVFYMSYNLGRGWKVSTEIEFEHGGTGSAVEIENEETGEYERDIEKGGEVVLEQFWIEKSFAKSANVRIGHIIVPIGLTNMYHMPTEFFSVLRPEEESSILPCTWHETGLSFWGTAGKWRYEAQFLAGLDAERFSNHGWIKDGSTSPYEFSIANSYATAVRIDNYSVRGLRLGLSGYFGFSAANSLKSTRYTNRDLNGSVSIGAFDAEYNDNNIIARGNFIYGYLGDSYAISNVNTSLPSASPSPRTQVASTAMSWYAELGYDIMSFFPGRDYTGDKLFIYGHYGFYDSMYKMGEDKSTGNRHTAKPWCRKNIISAGINYFPMKGLVIKAEYRMRKFKSPYNNEPTVSLGIGYAGLFSR